MGAGSKNFRAARGFLSGLGPLDGVLLAEVRNTNREIPIA